MKKIIVYGLVQVILRRKIENFLGDNYEIIGYSDTNYESDVIDGKTFIPSSQLCSIDFDYIVLGGVMESTRENMRRFLLELGIPGEKIISPLLLMQDEEMICQLDLIDEINNVPRKQDIEGLIFGPSYAMLGILKDDLKIAAHNCSYHGLDLYYSYKEYLYIQENGFFPNVNTVFFKFPYYYFDYDLSRSPFHYNDGRIISVRKMDDWHNYALTLQGNDYVANYKLFGDKIMKFYRRPRYERPIRVVHQEPDHSVTLGKIWFVEHKETVEENKQLLYQFVKKLQENKTRICLMIPPIYLKGIDQQSIEMLERKKKRFYDNLQQSIGALDKIEIFDYTDVFPDQREYYYEITHLNFEGAKEFTKIINRDIL